MVLRFKDESGVIYTLYVFIECLHLSWEAVAVAKGSILKERENQFLTFFCSLNLETSLSDERLLDLE